MKVVCIDDYTLSSGRKLSGLTPGKIYDVIRNFPGIFNIVDDNERYHWFNDEVLMPLEKYRELKLKELGI